MSSGAADGSGLAATALPRKRPQSVLFACSHNAVRSPMAEAIARQLFGREIYFASAGLRAGEKDGIQNKGAGMTPGMISNTFFW